MPEEGIRRGNSLAVNHHRVEPRLRPTNADVASFALVLGDRHASHALCCLSGVSIGKRSDLIRRHDVGDVGSALLLIEGAGACIAHQRSHDDDVLFDGADRDVAEMHDRPWLDCQGAGPVELTEVRDFQRQRTG